MDNSQKGSFLRIELRSDLPFPGSAQEKSARDYPAAAHDCDQLVPLSSLVREIMCSGPSRLR
jgi:hypothetical protein